MIDDLLDHLAGDEDKEPSPEEIDEMFDGLMQTSDAELRQMPQELVNLLYSLAEAGVLPEETGRTFSELLLEKRMERAAILLKGTTLPIEEIAAMLGYSNSSNFYKAFKRYYGFSPREYWQEAN